MRVLREDRLGGLIHEYTGRIGRHGFRHPPERRGPPPRIPLIQEIPAARDGGSVAWKGRTSVPTYLVERYWPGVTSELLLKALNKGRQVMEQMSVEGTPLSDVTSILICREEVVFSVYEGPSAAAVRQFNERAGIPVSRIVEATVITPG
jgi:hypothetical protein